MEWHKLTKKTMPPEGKTILLWRDYGNCGFPVLGNRYGDHIVYSRGRDYPGEIHHSEWRSTRWAMLEPPEGEIL